MKTVIKLPISLTQALKAHCKKEGLVEKIFYQSLIKFFFSSISFSKELMLVALSKEKKSSITIHLDEKLYEKVKLFSNFYSATISKALSSIIVIATAYQHIFDVSEHDYRVFTKDYQYILS